MYVYIYIHTLYTHIDISVILVIFRSARFITSSHHHEYHSCVVSVITVIDKLSWFIWLVVWTPLKKYCSLGIILPNWMESKPPTSYDSQLLPATNFSSLQRSALSPMNCREWAKMSSPPSSGAMKPKPWRHPMKVCEMCGKHRQRGCGWKDGKMLWCGYDWTKNRTQNWINWIWINLAWLGRQELWDIRILPV